MLPVLVAAIVAITSPGGHAAYEQQCATCHGNDLRGGPNGPSIRGAGAADVDFWVGTGRMPAAVPWIQVGHRGPQMPEATIAAIVAYVVSVQPGGPPIPAVTTNGDAERGQTLFRENCMHCHGAAAGGAAIGQGQWAPTLNLATATQVGEAIRVGPGQMPRFGEQQLARADVDDIATYLARQRADAAVHGLPGRSSGPVPEGLLGWLAAGLLAFLAYAFTAAEKETTS